MPAPYTRDPDSEADVSLDRREFLRLMGASLALSGASGCTSRPRERVLPYVVQPPEVVPGRPTWFATSMDVDGVGIGLLAESHEGRPTKIEGHPEHPASLGAASLHAQASILGLYDPDRARTVRVNGASGSSESFVREFSENAPGDSAARGRGLHFLLEPTSSPLIASLLARVSARYPDAKIHYYTPLGAQRRWEGARAAFGRLVEPRCDFTRAAVVVSLGADFLGSSVAPVRYARDFASRRRLRSPADAMNRLYVVETGLSITGAKADHRLRRKPSEIPAVARALCAEVWKLAAPKRPALQGALPPAFVGQALDERALPWVRAAARDLAQHAGECLVVAGDGQDASVHALAHAMNEVLGSAGSAVTYIAPPILDAGMDRHDLRRLSYALDEGDVDTLVILAGNPIYSAPERFDLAGRIRRARRRVYLGLYENETAAHSETFLPARHFLEDWRDTRAFDGTVSFAQPLVAPLYGGFSDAQILAVFAGIADVEPRSLLRRHWAEHGLSAEADWEAAVARGLLLDTAFSVEDVRCDLRAVADFVGTGVAEPTPAGATKTRGAFELNLVRDARVDDGRFANNAVLQELPDPMTHLSWGNAALVSVHTAEKLGVNDGRRVRISSASGAVEAPVLVVPGHADDSVTLSLGYGRTGAERVARGVGVRASLFVKDGDPTPVVAVTVEPVAGSAALALQHEHASLEGRNAARAVSLDAYRKRTTRRAEPLPMLYHFARSATEQWAMSIDLTACTGCSACVVACQIENNVPIVGHDWVIRGREMHWIRIDRYEIGNGDDVSVVVQPMLCQHCEKAPCEYVCPVGATTHSDEGLNEMTYNRCVGTRFCSNNCPYKVRRFNYLNYNAALTAPEQLSKNPNVTVRGRGVMEKCTYCVQRIRAAEIRAKDESRRLEPGEVVTACAQTCPTRAIVFGSLTEERSEVAMLARNDRRYDALGELGTRPRTSYLECVTNPNPDFGTTS